MSKYAPKKSLDYDKEWLIDKYTVKQMSLLQIGKTIGCTAGTIKSWLENFNIPIRTPIDRIKCLRDVDTGKKAIELFNSGMSLSKISKKIGVSVASLSRFFHVANIRRKKFTKINKEWLIDQYVTKQHSLKDISKSSGIPKEALISFVRQENIDKTISISNLITNDYLSGETISNIKLKYKMSPKRIKRILTNNNIKIRTPKEASLNKYESAINKFIGNDYTIMKYDEMNVGNHRKHAVLHRACGKNFTISVRLLVLRTKREYTLCTHCNPIKKGYSEIERVFMEFVTSICPSIIKQYRIKTYRVDGLVRNTNICIEFDGDLYHANPRKYSGDDYISKLKTTAQQIWDKDKGRTNFIISKGFKLVRIWESDWLKYKDEVKFELKEFLSTRCVKNKKYLRFEGFN